MGKFIDITGQIFNDWKVLYRDNEKKSEKIYWKCKCLLCGTEKSVLGADIRNGKSKNCGCVRRQKIIQRNQNKAKDITGKQYGYLIAIKPTNKRKNTYVVWQCQCTKCNKFTEVCLHDLEKGSTYSCGCMNESHGEFIIKKILELNNISYETEKTFNSCRFPDSKNLARFNFYIDNSYLIEFDGSQHFSPQSYNNCNWNNEDNFLKIKKRDTFKNQWCKENNIPLIRIPYNRLQKLCIEDLKPETTQFLI